MFGFRTCLSLLTRRASLRLSMYAAGEVTWCRFGVDSACYHVDATGTVLTLNQFNSNYLEVVYSSIFVNPLVYSGPMAESRSTMVIWR